jgi:Domain of unknown function (DUF4386)
MSAGSPGTVEALTRTGGVTAIGGGLVFMGGVAAHPLRDGFTIRSLGSVYGAEHGVILLGLLLQLIAIVGLQIREVQRGAPIDSRTLHTVLVGQVLWVMLITIGATWNPLLAQYRPEDVHITMSDQLITALTVAAMIAFALGHALFGLHVVRANDLPRIAGALIAIGAPVYVLGGLCIFMLGPQSPWVTVIETAGAIPMGIGFIGLGRFMRVTRHQAVA